MPVSIIAYLKFLTFLALFLLGLAYLETWSMERKSLHERMASLELDAARSKIPIINIQNASVYTVDGVEIVIEGHDK